jgi:hypothetical protein
MPRFEAPDNLDPNDLQAVLALVHELRAAGVRSFKHPNGIELTLDASKPAPPKTPSEF